MDAVVLPLLSHYVANFHSLNLKSIKSQNKWEDAVEKDD